MNQRTMKNTHAKSDRKQVVSPVCVYTNSNCCAMTCPPLLSSFGAIRSQHVFQAKDSGWTWNSDSWRLAGFTPEDGLRKPSLRKKRGCSVLAMRGQLYLWVERRCLMYRIHFASKVGMLHTFTVQPWVGQSWITSFLIWRHTGIAERAFGSLFTNRLPLSASKYSFAKEYG